MPASPAAASAAPGPAPRAHPSRVHSGNHVCSIWQPCARDSGNKIAVSAHGMREVQTLAFAVRRWRIGVTGATSCSEHFAQNPLEAPCCRTRRRRRARNRLREREAVPRRQAVSIVAPSTRAPPASATALPRRTPGDGPQRPRAAKPSRGHAPQPGHRPAQPPVAAHPDRPRPQGAGLRPPAPFILSAVGAQFTNHVCAAGSQVVFATPPRSPHKHDQTLCT